MAMNPPIPRPPSRSERLLRDALRRDDTLRTHAAHSSRPRSASSVCDDDDDDFFQSAILYRCSSRRNSAASALLHQPNGNGFYVPDHNETASYSTLFRSSSHSGSSRSGRSDCVSSPRSAYTHERQEESVCHNDAAPHEAVLRSRLDKDFDPLDALTPAQSSTASLPSSLGSISNSRPHSHESHQTRLTVPDPDTNATVSPAYRPERTSPRGHRHTQSASVAHAHLSSPNRSTSPTRVSSPSSRSPRSPQALRSPPRTPSSQEKDQLRRTHPDSPWMYAPLPPSPPAFSTSPLKCGGPAVVTFVANPPIVERHTAHLSSRPHVRHSPTSSTAFDPDAASHALRQLPGYVSFSSVAGLGAPPEEEDRRGGRRSLGSLTLGTIGKGRLSGLGLGSGKWWMF